MASHKGGVAKREFLSVCEKFEIASAIQKWDRMINLKGEGLPLSIYAIDLRWYCHEAAYYKKLIQLIHEKNKGTIKLPALMGQIPTGINRELLKKTFKITDF